MLDKKPFTEKQLSGIQNNTKQDFGDDLRQAVTTSIIISLLDSADSYLHVEWNEFAYPKAMERTLDSIMIIRRVKDAQCFKPLPVHKPRFLYRFMSAWSRLKPVIAASLWRLIHDGKVQGIESCNYFAEEERSFKEDMERAFQYHRAQYCHDTVALQVTWNEQVGALEGKALEDMMTGMGGIANNIKLAGIYRRSGSSWLRLGIWDLLVISKISLEARFTMHILLLSPSAYQIEQSNLQ